MLITWFFIASCILGAEPKTGTVGNAAIPRIKRRLPSTEMFEKVKCSLGRRVLPLYLRINCVASLKVKGRTSKYGVKKFCLTHGTCFFYAVLPDRIGFEF